MFEATLSIILVLILFLHIIMILQLKDIEVSVDQIQLGRLKDEEVNELKRDETQVIFAKLYDERGMVVGTQRCYIKKDNFTAMAIFQLRPKQYVESFSLWDQNWFLLKDGDLQFGTYADSEGRLFFLTSIKELV